MATLSIKLQQHTPIIHFQHYQEGATLRASELKPKLDKFLIDKFKKEHIDYKRWLIGDNKDALNYKVKIIYNGESWKDYIENPIENKDPRTIKDHKFVQKPPSEDGTVSTKTDPYPLFFGNMGKDYEKEKSIKKFVLAKDNIELNIQSFNPGLIETIKNNFNDFIALENFGSRQDKGFGSFYIYEKDENYKPISETLFDYKFKVITNSTSNLKQKFTSIFTQVDLFYRALRAGINLKDFHGNDKFYFKSLLFLYFKNKNIQWEKKTIKENFFLKDVTKRDGSILYYGLNTQKTNRPLSDALKYSNNNKKLVKDLFGLSTEESWLSYKNRISKIEARADHRTKKDKQEEQIERFKSPIIFKIVEENTSGDYIVYIKLIEEIPIKGKWFIIEGKLHWQQLPLQIPKDFSLHDFFDFITDKSKFNITKHVESIFQTNPDGSLTYEYKTLKNIFDNITKIE